MAPNFCAQKACAVREVYDDKAKDRCGDQRTSARSGFRNGSTVHTVSAAGRGRQIKKSPLQSYDKLFTSPAPLTLDHGRRLQSFWGRIEYVGIKTDIGPYMRRSDTFLHIQGNS